MAPTLSGPIGSTLHGVLEAALRRSPACPTTSRVGWRRRRRGRGWVKIASVAAMFSLQHKMPWGCRGFSPTYGLPPRSTEPFHASRPSITLERTADLFRLLGTPRPEAPRRRFKSRWDADMIRPLEDSAAVSRARDVWPRTARNQACRRSLTARSHAVGVSGNGSGWRQSSPPGSFRCRGTPGRQ